MTDRQIHTVCAVVVTHHPEALVLEGLLVITLQQAGHVVVVDNSEDGACLDIPALSNPRVELIRQGRNGGLAQAQNVGIAWARQHAFEHVLLLDQDSAPGRDMVAVLMEALNRLSREGLVAAVGPRFHDLREDRDAPFVKMGFPLNRKLWCEGPGQVVACDFLISSGSLISLGVLNDVGSMDEDLFIDNVDLEWSFRARSRGYALYGVCAATMHHRLGDARRRLPLGLGQVVVHGPVRLYYMMRNRLRLYRMPHTPRIWVAQDVPRVAVKLFLFGVMFGPRLRNLRFMLAGLRDGMRGRSGPCPLA